MVSTISARALGQRVRQLRTRRGLTQQDLAGDDYSKSYISAIEQGKTRPSLEALQRIAARLEVPAGTLLDPDAPGFAPFDPEAMHRRVRRRRGYRAGGEGQPFDPMQTDLRLSQAEILVHTGRPQEALDILRPMIPEDGQGQGENQAAPGTRLLDASQLQKACYLAAAAVIRTGGATEALAYLQRGMGLAQRLGDREGLERMRNLLGVAYYQADQPLSALEHHRTCLEAVQSDMVRDPNFKLRVYNNIAADYWALHDNERALNTYKTALDLLESINRIERQAQIFWELVPGYVSIGDYQLAKVSANKSSAIYEALDNMQLVAQMQNRYGDVLVEMGDLDGAETYLRRSMDLAESLNSDPDKANAMTHLARLDMHRGNLDAAEERANQAVDLAREAVDSAQGEGDDPSENSGSSTRSANRALSEALTLAGEIATRRNDNDKADRLFTEAIDLMESAGGVDGSSDIYQRYAHVLASRGQHEKASGYFERAYRAVTRRSR